MSEINYPLWTGRLEVLLRSVLDAVDHPDEGPVADSVAVSVARRFLTELAALNDGCPPEEAT